MTAWTLLLLLFIFFFASFSFAAFCPFRSFPFLPFFLPSVPLFEFSGEVRREQQLCGCQRARPLLSSLPGLHLVTAHSTGSKEKRQLDTFATR
jgi:hypothetical protein